MARTRFLPGALAAVMLCSAPLTAARAQHSHGHSEAHDAAAGEPGDPKKPARVINVAMREDGAKMLFIPARVTVQHGEQIRFVLRNNGAQEHEFFIGSAEEVNAHAQEMKDMPNMQHAEANVVRLPPKGSGELLWRFSRPGEVVFACLIPGHLEAGMKGVIAVK